MERQFELRKEEMLFQNQLRNSGIAPTAAPDFNQFSSLTGRPANELRMIYEFDPELFKGIVEHAIKNSGQGAAAGPAPSGPGGKLSTDYRWNPATGTAEPIPGSKAALDLQQKAEIQEQQSQAAAVNREHITDDINFIRKTLPKFGAEFGNFDRLRSKIDPGSAQADVVAAVDSIKAKATLTRLQALKKAGATLGSVTERELQLLADDVANLSLTQSPERIESQLQKIEERLIGVFGAGQNTAGGRNYSSEAEVIADFEAGVLKTGDIVTINGEQVRI